MASEFDLISRFFTRPTGSAVLGVGDDAALIRPTADHELVVSADMLVAGRHFLVDTDARDLGHKTLAVNLSDLAAMGARPRWAMLSLALPAADEGWLTAFSEGFFALAERHGVELIGGDLTRGPLNLSVCILGEIETGQALRRDGGGPDEDVWVSGELGAGALGLCHLRGEIELPERHAIACRHRLQCPEPRVGLGRALRGLASAAIDISDGLLADLGHVLDRSRVGATIELDRIPIAEALALHPERVAACALAGGDDYELCFTAAMMHRPALNDIGRRLGVPLTRIGRTTVGSGLRLIGGDGSELGIPAAGYDHFAV